jgi:hypothetical protein
MTTITITADLIDAIEARYDALGGSYYGTDSIVRFAQYTLDDGFVGSVADFIDDVASDLRQND